jgi:hypothetical protein
LATIDFAGAQRWAKSSTGESALGHHRFRRRAALGKIEHG